MRTLAWLGLVALVVGVLGPRFSPDGASRFSGEQRQYAEEALVQGRLHLENPLERTLLAAGLRVTAVKPLPPGTGDHLGAGPCNWVVTVKAYSVFWLPYKTLTIRCGNTSG